MDKIGGSNLKFHYVVYAGTIVFLNAGIASLWIKYGGIMNFPQEMEKGMIRADVAISKENLEYIQPVIQHQSACQLIKSFRSISLVKKEDSDDTVLG